MNFNEYLAQMPITPPKSSCNGKFIVGQAYIIPQDAQSPNWLSIC